MDYKKQLKQWQARREKAVQLKERGYSLEAIGKMLHPQVSRQAVAKLIKRQVGG